MSLSNIGSGVRLASIMRYSWLVIAPSALLWVSIMITSGACVSRSIATFAALLIAYVRFGVS